MTMPNERARALQLAGAILRELQTRQDVPEDLRRQATVALRHYPEPHDLEHMIRDVDGMPRQFLDQHWLAPEVEDRNREANAALCEDAKRQSMARETQRKALFAAFDLSEWGGLVPVGREFGSPDFDRLQELDSLACQVLGVEGFRQWLITPNPSLDGKTPEEFSALPCGMERIRAVLADPS